MHGRPARFGPLALLGTAVLGTAVQLYRYRYRSCIQTYMMCARACVWGGGSMRAHPCMHGEADGTRAVRLHA